MSDQKEERRKESYSSPELVVYGTVQDLTRQNSVPPTRDNTNPIHKLYTAV